MDPNYQQLRSEFRSRFQAPGPWVEGLWRTHPGLQPIVNRIMSHHRRLRRNDSIRRNTLRRIVRRWRDRAAAYGAGRRWNDRMRSGYFKNIQGKRVIRRDEL